MKMYERVTDPSLNFGEATLEAHISSKECYDRLQELENEIINHTIQYRMYAILPLHINYNSPEEKPKYICQECHSKLPMNYKRFCPNCGIRLRNPEGDQ